MNYIPAYGQIVAIFEKTSTGQAMHYVHTDHLGSVNVITSQAGTIEQELSYDAWGNRRNPDTWVNLSTPPANLITSRGFTGHEHMDEFRLINMKGRVYDPVMGRFLSADPFVADPTGTQDYNRYSYCVNNPLMFTDPSGYVKYEQPVIDISAVFANNILGVFNRGGVRAYDWNIDGKYKFSWNIVDNLLNSPFGGTWSTSRGMTYFKSDEEALDYGMAYVDYHNGWGYTEHKSWAGTVNAYYELKFGDSYLLACINCPNMSDRDFIIKNGQKIYWNDIKTGNFNYTTLIVSKSKVQFSHQQTLDWLYEWGNIHESSANKIGWISFIMGIPAAVAKAIGLPGFALMQFESERQESISDEYERLSYLYNNLEDENGLWMIQTQNTFVNNGIYSHSSSFEFYSPNGCLFYSISY